MAEYKAPSAPCTKYNATVRIIELERVACSVDSAIRELTARFERIPPRGEMGPAGLSITGPAGPAGRDGKDGRDGRNGADSVVPGPAGQVGKDGADGKDSPQREEFTAFLNEVRKLVKDLRQEFEVLRADQDLLSHAFTDVSQKNQEYLAWLQVKVAERMKAHQQ